MTTERARKDIGFGVRYGAQDLEIESNISAPEKPSAGPVARHREAIHEFGCRIVAEALDK
jgi:hypothetical protein